MVEHGIHRNRRKFQIVRTNDRLLLPCNLLLHRHEERFDDAGLKFDLENDVNFLDNTGNFAIEGENI
ncbi:hypothetical protein L596_007858 [Steinernema carpocapsae]|uniref:Uncharacterized protein n=1 Tax=Steinernema carpocapsae TaxID=34508 RepID=A0A4U5PAQ4_STECR|nr:hypothetical protein L596_007858 [Steinernema carpocapsae]